MNREITLSDICEAVWPLTENCDPKTGQLIDRFNDIEDKSGPRAKRALDWAETIGTVASISPSREVANVNVRHAVGRLSLGIELPGVAK